MSTVRRWTEPNGIGRKRWARRMKLPRSQSTMNATLAARHEGGLSVEVVDVSGEQLRDERVGLCVRFRFTLDDGATFEIDSLELSDMLHACEVH